MISKSTFQAFCITFKDDLYSIEKIKVIVIADPFHVCTGGLTTLINFLYTTIMS